MFESNAKLVSKIKDFLSESISKEASEIRPYEKSLEYSVNVIENQSLESLEIESKHNTEKEITQKLNSLEYGKEEMSKKVNEVLNEEGYDYIPENQLSYKSHYRPLDSIAVKNDEILLIEEKSSSEVKDLWGAATGDYKSLINRPDYVEKYYPYLEGKVKNEILSKEVASHMYFLEKLEHKSIEFNDGKWYPKENLNYDNKNIKIAYAVPTSEKGNVIEALNQRQQTEFKIIEKNDIAIFIIGKSNKS